jgi:preprotein translocase subunit SecB
MSATGSNGDIEQGGGADNQPRVQAISQYVKDLSFENPSAPQQPAGRPAIDLGVDLQARRLDQQHFEVTLKLRVSATSESKPVFLLELAYAGLFQIVNVPEEALQGLLLVDCPYIIFPFARRIVADTIRDGALPPLMIDPIDFAALYRSKASELAQARSTGSETSN